LPLELRGTSSAALAGDTSSCLLEG
jgi:hypothetical protein